MRKLLIGVALALVVAIPSLSSAASAPENLARGAAASASSAESSAYGAASAIDGDLTTRWSSTFSDPQTLELDLGARASISAIVLRWEAAYGRAYTLEVSNDRMTWTPVASTTSGDGGADEYSGLAATGRYVRLTGTQRATQYGYSLYEFEVVGEYLETSVALAAPAYGLPEKDGTVTVPVRLNRAASEPVTVKYATANGTAEAGKDYEAASGTLTFAPGELEQPVTLRALDDQLDEPGETFTLALSDPSGAALGARPSATVTIADDDETAFSGRTLGVFDFEGDLHVQSAPNPDSSGLFTFGNSTADRPALTAEATPRPQSVGTQSMRVVSNIEAWGGFSDNLAATQDWSAYDGFAFWLKGTNTGRRLQFEIKDGGADAEHAELWESHVTDDSTAWRLVRVPFASFTRRGDYQPPGGPTDRRLDLTRMWGFAMNLGTGANAFLIDDVHVYEQVITVEDFEGPRTLAARGINTFNGGGGPPALAIESQPRDGVADNHALKVDYDVPSGGYGGFVQDFAEPQDWSAFAGLRFWYFGRPHGAAPGRVYFEIKDGGSGPGASELWNTSFLDDTLGWHLVTIPFSKLRYRGDYQPVGGIDHVLNLTKLWGWALTVPPGQSGSFDFDDVQVYGVAGAPPDVSAAFTQDVQLGGEGTTVDVGVKLTTLDGGPTADAVAIDYATGGGTATAGSDYEPASGTLNFPAGTPSGTVASFPVKLLADAEPAEVAERIDVTLTSADAGMPDAPASVVINAHGLPYLNPALPVEQRVSDVLGRMTLAEKVGQMTQAERQALGEPGEITAYNLGSLLSGGGSTPTPNTPQGWADMVDGFQTHALATRLQIPLIYGVDAVHGHNNVDGATLFPHNLGLGAMHDPALVQQVGIVTGAETKATGVPWTFAPCVCVARDERWGRTYESFGEDPALVIRNETIIDGLREHGVLATAKHFAGDGGTVFGTGSGAYTIDQGVTPLADLETLHLSPYVEALRRGVGTVMPSFSSIGYPGGPVKMHADGNLITGWLKQQHGFDGFVITDWQAIDQLPGDYPSDVRSSINAGIDMVMVPYEFEAFEATLTAEIVADRVSLARIDDAVRRILRKKLELGLFERPYADRTHQAHFGSAMHRAVARQAAAESQVLLTNDGVLPLAKTAKLYLAGSNADDVGNQAGGWTITWQGGSGETTSGATSILEGMRAVAPDASITYSQTASAPTDGYDAGVVVVGETPYAEGVGDVGNGRADLSLSAADRAAIDRVCGAMRCAVLVVSGRPMLVGDQLPNLDALVASWLPGSEGTGVADVLFGEQPFTGRLPMTWMRAMAQLPINVGDAAYDPQFPYGWGLRTDSPRARLQAARDMGVSTLDAVLAANVWNADGSVRHGAELLARLRTAATGGIEPWAAADLVVSVARDLAQAAMLRDGIGAAASALTADAEHALYAGDVATALTKLSEVAVRSTSVTGGVGGVVAPTLSLALGGPVTFGAFVPGVERDYVATMTATVISTAGDALLSVADPSPNAPGHLVNGAYALPSALQARGDGVFGPIGAAPLTLHAFAGPVSNDVRTLALEQHIGATDGLRTGSYRKAVVFTLSTTQP